MEPNSSFDAPSGGRTRSMHPDAEGHGEINSESWWHTLGVLYAWRRFIIIITVLAAVASISLSLMMPNVFRSSTRLLLPEGGGGGLASAMLGNLSSAASSILGGGGGDYVRYMAILNSDRVLESAVDSFDLVNAYEVADEEFPRSAAVAMLHEYLDVSIDDEYEFMSIAVIDQDPQRAADITNFFVRALDRVQNDLSSRTAGLYRQYVEDRFEESRLARMTVLDSLEAFQRQYGIISLEAQTEAYFAQLADLRSQAVQAEIQYETLRGQFGENNPNVRRAKNIVDAADRVFQESLSGKERVFPVSEDETPTMVKRYLELVMEQTIQEAILEFAAPVLEQARFEEQKQIEALQIVDPARPPVKKHAPRRSIIVIFATLSGAILAIIFALVMNWWLVNNAYFYDRLGRAAEQAVRPKQS